MTGIDVKFSEAMSSMPFLQIAEQCLNGRIVSGALTAQYQDTPLALFLIFYDTEQLWIRAAQA